MYIHLEDQKSPGTYVNQFVRGLSWINSTENRNEGYLASGVYAGIVGITCTNLEPCDSRLGGNSATERRVNINIRAHMAPVTCVQWNTRFGYLTTGDEKGSVFLWKRMENDQWTIQLLCRMDSKVLRIRWNSSGQLAVIITDDGSAAVYTVTGEYRWTSPNPNYFVRSAAFMPATTTSGESEQLLLACPAHFIVVNCNHFTMEVVDASHLGAICLMDYSAKCFNENAARLAIATVRRTLLLLKNIGSRKGVIHRGIGMAANLQWSSDGYMLAVISICTQLTPSKLLIYRCDGAKCFERNINAVRYYEGFTAMAWAYSSECLIFSQGRRMFTLRLAKRFPCLQMLASKRVMEMCSHSSELLQLTGLPGPSIIHAEQSEHSIIQCLYPKRHSLMQFVCRPMKQRFYGLMVPMGSARSPFGWELLMEHAGGYVPLLRAYRVGLLQSEYAIWTTDYALRRTELSHLLFGQRRSHGFLPCYPSRRRRQQRAIARYSHFKKIALVSSNVWGNKFALRGLNRSVLPMRLGEVAYHSDILHSQPRQMTVKLVPLDYPAERSDNERFVCREAKSCLEANVCVALMDRLKSLTDMLSSCFMAFRGRDKVDELKNSLPEVVQAESGPEAPLLSGADWWEKKLEGIAYIDEGVGDDGDPIVEENSSEAVPDPIEALPACPPDSETEFPGSSECAGSVRRYLLETEKLINNFQNTLSFCLSRSSSEEARSSRFNPPRRGSRASAIEECSLQLWPLCRLVHCWRQEISGLKSPGNGANGWTDLSLMDMYLLNSQVDAATRFLECVDMLMCRFCRTCQVRDSEMERRNVVVLNNAPPDWNRNLDIFQLDFGGRVTRQSVKNFMINHNDQQILQFGRTGGSSFVLDFESPFSPVQAFALALTSVAKR
uniref:WD_REPEATS_REGION domain-containing protein n=1 Tax=Trichuris muris TaxID=70415 RepID=A0A5S6QEA1_TRIMR